MSKARTELARLTAHFPVLNDCIPLSPQAYNKISSVILESLYDCIEEIDALSKDIRFYSNLGVILYCELHHSACTHYFKEYEYICGFGNSHSDSGYPIIQKNTSPYMLLRQAKGKILRILQERAASVTLRNAPQVAWVGNTTFPWHLLTPLLHNRGIRFMPAKFSGKITFPKYIEQEQSLEAWADDLYTKFVDLLGPSTEIINKFGIENIRFCIRKLFSIPALLNGKYDLLVTGTLGHLPSRLLALQANSRDIPVMTIEHGSHSQIFDEPYAALYETALANMKVGYGSIQKQLNLETFGITKNLSGNSVQFYSRTDSTIQRLYHPGKIRSVSSLKGLKAVYIANHCEGLRYGPYRDVHPSTYLKWQEQLLVWLDKQKRTVLFYRAHPKRRSSCYDPTGYQYLDGDIAEVVEMGDLFVIDYPTTVFGYIAATNKPVLYFDIGLRNLHPAALEAVRGRCHYAEIDMLDPKVGFMAMELDLSRQCSNTFTPVFSLASVSKSEVDTVSDAVITALTRIGKYCY